MMAAGLRNVGKEWREQRDLSERDTVGKILEPVSDGLDMYIF